MQCKLLRTACQTSMRTLQVRLLLRQGLPNKPLEHAQTHMQGAGSFAAPSRQFCHHGWTCHHLRCCHGGNEKWKADLRREAMMQDRLNWLQGHHPSRVIMSCDSG